MAATNPYASYKQKALDTTSPGELTLMLYNGCLKFIKRAEKAIEENNMADKNINLIKAQDIIRELMVTLKVDSEVGENMMRLYDFILSRLVDANVQNDLKVLKEAEELVTDFRDTWKEVLLIDRKQRHGLGGQA